ncbi:MAG: hypothetical protein M3016_02455, partial [Actinomycetota bacterium]|nr:hypothetical protein [Actinomycetota bacterium]
MSDVVDIPTQGEELDAPIPFTRPRRRWRGGGSGGWGRNGSGGNGTGGDGFRGRRRNGRPRVRKLRLLLILTGFGALALISTVFGMMMAVASDLPQIENKQEY